MRFSAGETKLSVITVIWCAIKTGVLKVGSTCTSFVPTIEPGYLFDP